jgi:uncharacterized protein (DUF427 family)
MCCTTRLRESENQEITMTERPVLQPTAEHPITVVPTGGRVVVKVDGEIVADSVDALTLQESTYPAVQYIPLGDVVQKTLSRTDTSTYCPYKGDAIWTYEQPYPAVAAIVGHVAFYPDKADITVTPAG